MASAASGAFGSLPSLHAAIRAGDVQVVQQLLRPFHASAAEFTDMPEESPDPNQSSGDGSVRRTSPVISPSTQLTTPNPTARTHFSKS
jgi:hypothetical protein